MRNVTGFVRDDAVAHHEKTALEASGLTGQLVLLPDIVLVCEKNNVVARLRQGRGEVLSRPARRPAKYANARIAKTDQHFETAVGGAVVRNDELVAAPELRQDGIDLRKQMASAVAMHTDIEGRIDDSSASHRKCAGLINSPGFHGADGLPMHAEQARAARDVTVSIVSHGQNAMVNMLLMDIAARCAERVAVVVTANRQDAMELETALPYPLQVVRNAAPKGFGANHNAAFRFCRTEYFCVANPDIRLQRDPFVPLVETASRRTAGAVGPLVRNLEGEIEDSARRYPTLLSLLGKVLRPKRGPDYEFEGAPLAVDWVAGMFMVFPREAYGAVGGFDESYFLYYEDVDLCRRLHRAGRAVFFDPRSEVYHAAQRSSRRNLRMALHHAVSALRFLLRP